MTGAWLAGIGAGLASALLLALPLAGPGGLFFALLVPLPLFAAGLALGARGAAIAGVVVLAAVALAGGPWPVLGVGAVLVAPVWVLVRQALLSRPVGNGGGVEWYPAGLLVTWLSGWGLAWLALATLLFAGGEAGLEATVREQVARSLGSLMPQAPEADVGQLAEAMAGYAIGLSLASWMLLLAVNGALAQGALTRFGRNLRPAPELASMELPPWLAGLLALAAVAFFAPGVAGFVGQNALLVLLVPYFFVGLAVLHTVARRMTARVLFLVVCYAILVIFTWPALLLAGLGLIEQWARLRRRLAAGGRGKEDD